VANFQGGSGPDHFIGTDGKDDIRGGDGNDLLIGGGYRDDIGGEGGDDVLHGGEGSDSLAGGAGEDTLYGEAGADSLTGGAGRDRILGGAGDDRVTVTFADGDGDLLNGGEGVDLLIYHGYDGGSAGFSFSIADPGTAVLLNGARLVGFEAFFFEGSDNADQIKGWQLNDQLDGRLGNDILFGLAGDDRLFGNDGDDRLYGGYDQDIIEGGIGNDLIYGDEGDDVLNGGGGVDYINGGAGDDFIMEQYEGGGTWIGGDGDDVIYSHSYSHLNDIDDGRTVIGGRGDDVVVAGGFDTVSGGTGFDDLTVNFKEQSPAENLRLSNGIVRFASGGVISGFEKFKIFASNGDDRIVGAQLDDALYGRDGNDVLQGAAGDDQLQGNAGNDRLYGGEGRDLLAGEFGADYIFGEGGDDLVEVFVPMVADGSEAGMDPPIDRINGGSGFDTVYFVDYYTFGLYIDLANQIRNRGGAKNYIFTQVESFVGHNADDTLHGSSDGDHFYGADGSDILNGRAGDDLLNGGEGSDVMYGGAGRDLFDFSPQQSLYDANHDVIRWQDDLVADFRTGEDRLRFTLADYGFASASAFRLISSNAPVATGDGAVFLFNQTTGELRWDSDGGGDASALRIARLAGVTSLSSSDFLLV